MLHGSNLVTASRGGPARKSGSVPPRKGERSALPHAVRNVPRPCLTAQSPTCWPSVCVSTLPGRISHTPALLLPVDGTCFVPVLAAPSCSLCAALHMNLQAELGREDRYRGWRRCGGHHPRRRRLRDHEGYRRQFLALQHRTMRSEISTPLCQQ